MYFSKHITSFLDIPRFFFLFFFFFAWVFIPFHLYSWRNISRASHLPPPAIPQLPPGDWSQFFVHPTSSTCPAPALSPPSIACFENLTFPAVRAVTKTLHSYSQVLNSRGFQARMDMQGMQLASLTGNCGEMRLAEWLHKFVSPKLTKRDIYKWISIYTRQYKYYKYNCSTIVWGKNWCISTLLLPREVRLLPFSSINKIHEKQCRTSDSVSL